VGIICANPPARPANVNYTSIRELYLHYESIFLLEGKTPITSPCGHHIVFFDHHFFQMVSIAVDGKGKLFLRRRRDLLITLSATMAPVQGIFELLARH
jgi:hypothetical protein